MSYCSPTYIHSTVSGVIVSLLALRYHAVSDPEPCLPGADLALAWSSIMGFDTAVFILTLLQALRAGQTWSHSLFHIILRDGKCLQSFICMPVADVDVVWMVGSADVTYFFLLCPIRNDIFRVRARRRCGAWCDRC